MLKINSSQKKILKISILIFTVMISSLLFTNSVSAITVKGKNLLNKNNLKYNSGDVNVSVLDTGVRLTASTSAPSQYVSYIIGTVSELVGETLTLSVNMAHSSTNTTMARLCYLNANGSYNSDIGYITSSGSLTKTIDSSSAPYVGLLLYQNKDTSTTVGSYADYTNIQVERGTVATEYEPYYEYEQNSENEITITQHTYDTNVIYSTLKDNGIDVSNYKYIIMSGYFYNSDRILIYLFNDTFNWVTVDERTGGISKSMRSAPQGINYTVVFYQSDNTIIRSGNYVSNGVNSSSVANWYGYSGYFTIDLNNSGISAYSNYDTGITGLYGTVYNNYLTLPVSNYEFNEDIDVTDISKIKINFELPEDTSNLELSLYYSINALSNNSGLIGVPYISLTSKNENNYDVVDIIDSNYGIVERNNLISNMCDIVSCWDVFDSTKYNKTFQTCIDNLEQIDSTDINSSRLVKEELSNWYAEEYVNKLYDLALSLVNKSYIKNISYSNNFNMSLLPDSSVYKYSLEIDTVDYDGILNLNFISNLNYSIEYDYVIDNEDYYLTIDMSNYAALILIPKVFDTGTNISSSFLSNIYLNGIYDIELWENLESKTVLQRYNNFNKNIFSSYFHRLYNSSILYFINKNFGDDNYYIKFDSRYYNYSLKKTLSEEVIIVNPNTGENITIPDISDLYYYGTNKDNRFSFDSFLKPIKFVFESITNFYNNYCPTLVQYFLYLIFAFFVILVLIKVFL